MRAPSLLSSKGPKVETPEMPIMRSAWMTSFGNPAGLLFGTIKTRGRPAWEFNSVAMLKFENAGSFFLNQHNCACVATLTIMVCGLAPFAALLLVCWQPDKARGNMISGIKCKIFKQLTPMRFQTVFAHHYRYEHLQSGFRGEASCQARCLVD